MSTTLSAAVVNQDFPGATVDPGFTFTVTGTLVDGTPFAETDFGNDPTLAFDLAPGTYVGQVSKLGISSQPSAPFTISVPTTVTLSVPDATQAATLA